MGAPSLTLRLLGDGFTEASQIIWNGSVENTVFVSPNELNTGVQPETASGPWTIPV